MRAFLQKLRADRSGNALVELAFVAPFVIALIVGIVDFGRGVYTRMSLSSAARAGAEYVSRTGDSAGAPQIVLNAANLDPSSVTVRPASFCECKPGQPATCGTLCADGTSVRQFISITASQAYSPMLPYPGIPNSITLAGSAVLRVK